MKLIEYPDRYVQPVGRVVEVIGAAQAVGVGGDQRTFVGVPDPRGEGLAAGF